MKSKKAITLLVLTTLLMALMPAMPMASAVLPTGLTLDKEGPYIGGIVDASESTTEAIGENAIHLQSGTPLVSGDAGYPDADEGTIIIIPPAGFTFGDIDTISWKTYLVSGYLPHVDFRNAVGTVTVEGAYQNGNSITGWATDTWISTFEGADGTIPAWGPSGYVGNVGAVTGDSVASKGGGANLYRLSDFQTATLVSGINENTVITAIEIEVDSWVVASEAYVDNIRINDIVYNFEESGTGFTIDSVSADVVVYDDELTIEGRGVTSASPYTIYWDYAVDGNILNDTEKGNPDGSWDATIDIPSSLAGEHYIWVVSGSNYASYGPITMMPRIKMSPSSGLEDDEVTIKGYGFGDEVDIVSVVTAAGDLNISPSTPETDELGYWTAKFDALASDFVILATDDDGNVGSKSFTVGPAIELDVDEGPVGTIVEVSGRGFTSDEDVIVTYPLDTDVVEVKSDGTFTIDVVIPQQSSTGDYTISVTETGGIASAEEDFDVVGLAEIEVTPGHGTQGSNILVEGWNFTAGEDVTISIGGLLAKDYEVDSDGTFEVTYTVPAVSTGEHTVLATQGDYDIDAETDFRAGIMIVILNPTSGPSGTSVTLTGTGFTKNGEWNATFGDETWVDDADTLNDATEISDSSLYVPTMDAGVYTISILDIDAEIMVDVEFTVTDTTKIVTNPVVAPAGYVVKVEGFFFEEDIHDETLADAFDEFVLYNETDEWDVDDLGWSESYASDVDKNDDLDDGYFKVKFTLPDSDEIGIGTYTLNVTDAEGMFAQLTFDVVTKTVDIYPRKSEFRIGDTLAFDVESSFTMDDSYIEISDPSGDLYWSTDLFYPGMWLKVGTIQRVLYADQVAGGNPMVFLEDAPLGSWTWEYIDPIEDDPIDTGAFTVTAAAADMVSGQVEALATDIDALIDEMLALSNDIVDYSGEFDSVKDEIAWVASLARDAVAAAEAAANAVTSVASVAGDAAKAAEDAAEAANAAKDAAGGLTTLVYGAIGASLVAALAAIVSLMQISRRIAG